MHRKIERRLKIATVLAVLSGYLALTTTFSYGTDILLVPLAAIALMPLGERLDRHFRLYRRATTIVILLFIALFFMILQRFSLLDAVIALVMFIQIYTLAHAKETKNYVHLFLMSFFLVLAAAVMSPRPDIAAVFFLFLVSTIFGLILLEMYSSGTGTPSTPQWRTTSGEIITPRKVHVFDARFSLLVAATATGMFLFAALLFIGGPRTEAGVFGAARMQEQATTGLSSEVDFSQAGALASSTTPVMRVVFPELENGQFLGPMFWRVTALDEYTGGGWQHRGVFTTGYGTDELRRFKSETRLASREGIDRPAMGWPVIAYELYLDRLPEGAVPLLQLPLMVKSSDEGPRIMYRWDIANDFSVVITARGESGVYLEATSEIMSPSPEQLNNSPRDYSRSMLTEDFEQLTYQDLLPETRALVDQLTRNEPTAYGKIMALQRHLQSANFEYTRLVPVLPATNPVDEFILRVREGHCQLFASALALMTRSLGLPTRLVSGYRGGTWNESDRSYTISEDMAHIWVEIYFTGVGWITFDPSPMDVQPDGFTVDALTRLYNQYIMRARMLWLRNVVSYSRERQGREFQDSAAKIVRSGLTTWEGLQSRDDQIVIGGGLSTPVLMLFTGSSLLVIVWIGFALRGWIKRRQVAGRPKTPDQRRATQLYAYTARRLRRLGIDTDRRTAEELVVAAEQLPDTESKTVTNVLTIYNAARFGNRPLSKSELKRWADHLNRLTGPGPIKAG